MRTKLIAIEGIDGSGKTVQFGLLAERLKALGHSVACREYPVYSSYFGKQIGRYLSGSDGVKATDVEQRSMALWFAMDRFFDMRNFKDGETDLLLINRYVLSNAVYQSIRDRDISKPDIVEWVFDLEYNVLGLPKPALNICFDVGTGQAGRNVEKKGFRDYVGNGKDVYESSASIQERAGNKYIELAEKYDDICIIRCTANGAMLPPERICDEVMEQLGKCGLI